MMVVVLKAITPDLKWGRHMSRSKHICLAYSTFITIFLHTRQLRRDPDSTFWTTPNQSDRDLVFPCTFILLHSHCSYICFVNLSSFIGQTIVDPFIFYTDTFCYMWIVHTFFCFKSKEHINKIYSVYYSVLIALKNSKDWITFCLKLLILFNKENWKIPNTLR